MQNAELTAVRDRVSARLGTALADHTAAFAELGTPLTELLAPAHDLLSGGKRLRALLCAVGWAGAQGGLSTLDDPAVTGAGAALELFQGAALVHDDVMDGSSVRRGMPAAHRRFATDHAEQRWLGEPDSYGTAAAILLGDLLLSVSAMELDRARAGAPGSAPARAVFDLMISEVAVGQYLDIRAQAMPWEAEPGHAVERSLEVVRRKSARYSVEHPLVLGAALGGARAGLRTALGAVGLPLGEAFQLRDDDLGVFGDPEATGKPAGDDLREGKRTVLVALAMERADEPGRRLLRDTLGRPDLGTGEVAQVRELLQSSGAVRAHEDLIAERYAAGRRAIDDAQLPAPVAEALVDLAEALTRRAA